MRKRPATSPIIDGGITGRTFLIAGNSIFANGKVDVSDEVSEISFGNGERPTDGNRVGRIASIRNTKPRKQRTPRND